MVSSKNPLIRNGNKKKWELTKDLPLVNVILKKYKEKDKFFDLMKYLEEGDQEKYFELLQQWKIDFEKNYLDKNSHLRFTPVRHQKCLMRVRRPHIRYLILIKYLLFIFLEPFSYC